MDQAEGMQVQNTAPMATPIPAQEAPPEKVLTQSEVNELVGRIKHDAYSKGLREGQAALQQPMQQNQPPAAQLQAGSMGGMPQITDDHIRQLIADEAQKQSHMTAAQNTLTSFVSQLGRGKSKYSDFDETVAKLGNFQNIPHIVKMATDAGIAEDVMYDLGKNPGKVASLTTLSYINPILAEDEMKKLVDSIRKNQEASKDPSIAEPLSQIRPSTVGTDNGSNSVRDLRRKSWART
jgi:hypothetical protein